MCCSLCLVRCKTSYYELEMCGFSSSDVKCVAKRCPQSHVQPAPGGMAACDHPSLEPNLGFPRPPLGPAGLLDQHGQQKLGRKSSTAGCGSAGRDSSPGESPGAWHCCRAIILTQGMFTPLTRGYTPTFSIEVCMYNPFSCGMLVFYVSEFLPFSGNFMLCLLVQMFS